MIKLTRSVLIPKNSLEAVSSKSTNTKTNNSDIEYATSYSYPNNNSTSYLRNILGALTLPILPVAAGALMGFIAESMTHGSAESFASSDHLAIKIGAGMGMGFDVLWAGYLGISKLVDLYQRRKSYR